jgi:hypothetical protein
MNPSVTSSPIPKTDPSRLPGLTADVSDLRFLSEIQLLAEELRTVLDTADELLSGVSFDGNGVPVAFERASWLMNTAWRLNLGILSELPSAHARFRAVHGEAPESEILEFQSVAEELKAVLDTADEILSGVSFDGNGVPAAFERASWLMNTARRLSLRALETAYSDLPDALRVNHHARA